MRYTFLTAILLITCHSAIRAQVFCDSSEILFRQSRSVVDPDFGGNRERLGQSIERIDSCLDANRTWHLREVRVEGGASPEGPVKLNENLSRRRASAIFDYFRTRTQLPDSLTNIEAVGRDWEGLRKLAVNDPALPDRAEVVALLDDIVASIENGEPDSEANLARLKGLCGGRPYAYMYRNLFPALRASRLYVEYVAERVPMPIVTGSLVEEPLMTLPELTFPTFAPRREGKPFYMALKTNMLYDLLAVPSLSAEFYVGKNFSVVANWMYGWWDNDARHRYWRAYGGDLAVRWWFGHAAHEKPLTGHHIGIYGGIVTYDFEFGGTGIMGGRPRGTLWDKHNRTAGVEYGYSLPVGRRINIDFTIGFGYLGGQYYKYVPKNSRYVWQSTHNLNWFGPTKAEVSLVWLIGNGNFNSKKGGRL